MRNAIHKYLEHADMQNIGAIDKLVGTMNTSVLKYTLLSAKRPLQLLLSIELTDIEGSRRLLQ